MAVSDQPSCVETGVAVAAQQEQTSSPGRSRRLRLSLLMAILSLMLFALWYDYKVARPGVEAAYQKVSLLNARINRAPATAAMTSRDVQQELGLAPSYLITQGNYQVEVYTWTAGLPFRSHEYYAIYTGKGQNPVFQRHYKFFLPVEELEVEKGPYSPVPDESL